MWFLGAGASVEAGIPTATEMTWDFKRRIYCADREIPLASMDIASPEHQSTIQRFFDEQVGLPPLGSDEEYSFYFESAFSKEEDRQAYIERALRGRIPSKGHEHLAAQLAADHAKIVWTTNFDGLVESALNAKLGPGRQPRVATQRTPDIATIAISRDQWPLVVKLHGDFQSRHLKNTRAELAQQEDELVDNLINTCQRWGLAVVGYSGRDHSIMTALERAADSTRPFQNGLFWFRRNGSAVIPQVAKLLEKAKSKGVEAATVSIDSFESLMAGVTSQLIGESDSRAELVEPASDRGSVQTVSVLVTAAVEKQVTALALDLSAATEERLAQVKKAWREGRRRDERIWLDELLSSPNKRSTIAPAVFADALRFKAGLQLDGNGDLSEAEHLLQEARILDPQGDDRRQQAFLLYRRGRTEEALSLLESSDKVDARILRAGLLLDSGEDTRSEEALSRLLAIEPGDLSEIARLRALLELRRGRLGQAHDSIVTALGHAPNRIGVRLLGAMIEYFRAIEAPLLPGDLARLPRPCGPEEALAGGDSQSALKNAKREFEQLLKLDLGDDERVQIEVWRLATLILQDARQEATARARTLMDRFPGHAELVLWIASADLEIDASAPLRAIEQRVSEESDTSTALLLARTYLERDRADDAVALLERLESLFSTPELREVWALFRAQAALAKGDTTTALALVDTVPEAARLGVSLSVLTVEAEASGDNHALIAGLRAAVDDADSPSLILDLCERLAGLDQWIEIARYADRLLEQIPGKRSIRLAIHTRFKLGELERCRVLLDTALVGEVGEIRIEFLRLRASVLERLGQVNLAIADRAEIVKSVIPASIESVLALARLQFTAGHMHEVAVCARTVLGLPGLNAEQALMLSHALANDDSLLAQQLWRAAVVAGISDDQVAMAAGLGFQLGLDEEMATVMQALSRLGEQNAGGITQFSIDELIRLQGDWAKNRQKTLDLYDRGEIGVHLLADALNVPVAQFYRVLLSLNENGESLRRKFPLRFRDGSRSIPVHVPSIAPGRLALDLSGLIVAAHLGILDHVERRWAPVKLARSTLAALAEQREQLLSHQPSVFETERRLLDAERKELIRVWEGDLPELSAPELSAAGGWARWVQLLRRASAEGAFVLDLPVADETKYGRPISLVSGIDASLLSMTDVRQALGEMAATSPSGELTQRGAELATRVGATLYLTEAGAEALSSSGLLPVAAQNFMLLVDRLDQDARRAAVLAIEDAERHADWIAELLRRVSDGIDTGRYELLPLTEAQGDSPEESRSPESSNSSMSAHPKGQIGDSSGDHRKEARRRVRETLPFRIIEELMRVPTGTVDAVWFDDRWIGRYRTFGSTRITDFVEITHLLSRESVLSDDQCWDLWMRCRSANVRWIPISAGEIVHFVTRAPVVDGNVSETSALRTIRRAMASLVEDSKILRVPPPEAIGHGDAGELEAVKGSFAAVNESIVDLWAQWSEQEQDATKELEIRSSWIARNLYMDMGLLRARVVHPDGQPDAGVSAMGATVLLLGALKLIGGGGEAKQRLAKTYCAWAFANLVEARFQHDELFRAALLDQIADQLSRWPSADHDDPRQLLAARVVASRLFEALPEPIASGLKDHRPLMDFLGRRTIATIEVGKWEIDVRQFARAAARARTSGRSTKLRTVGTKSIELTIKPKTLTKYGVVAGSGDSVIAEDSAFVALASTKAVRARELRKLRRQFDRSEAEWEADVAKIASTKAADERLIDVLELRHAAVAQRYGEMQARWQRGYLSEADMRPPDPSQIMGHMRMRNVGEDGFIGALTSAVDQLVREEGFVEAFRRFSALPVTLPDSLLKKLAALSASEREGLVRAQLARPTSPIGLLHSALLLAELGQQEARYARLGRRLLAKIVSDSWLSEFELLRLVARAAYYAQVRQFGIQPAIHLMAAWYHAHRFVIGMKSLGADMDRLTRIVERLAEPDLLQMFGKKIQAEQDIAHPDNVSAQRSLVAWMQATTDHLHLSEQLLGRMRGLLSHKGEAEGFPSIQLLQNPVADQNALGSWIQMRVSDDGAVRIGEFELIPSQLSSKAIREAAIDAIRNGNTESRPWFLIELATGPRPLPQADRERLLDAIDQRGLKAVLDRHGDDFRIRVRRIAYEFAASGERSRQQAFRNALRDLAAQSAQKTAETTSSASVAPNGTSDSEPQLSLLEALLILSSAEQTRLEMMNVFAADLGLLGGADPQILSFVRPTLESIVREAPLNEAFAFTPRLAEARGL
jgi:tetratricopeptide (TPR) repeat protein